MEYTNIIAAVPEGEHFDASAVNEGVWISEAHLVSLESTLEQNNTDKTAFADQISSAALRAQQAEEQVAAANNVISERDATIAAQAAEIAALKAAPAAPITATVKEKDDTGITAAAESDITKEANRLRSIRDGKKQ